MGRVFIDIFGGYEYGFDYSKHEGYWSGTSHVFKIFKGFGSKVIRSKPALLTGLRTSLILT